MLGSLKHAWQKAEENKKGHLPKKRRCPLMSGTIAWSSNLLRERRRLPGLIFWRLQPDLRWGSLEFGRIPWKLKPFFALLRRAGGAAGVRGGCRPASGCVFVSLSFRGMCIWFDACCRILLLHFLGATKVYCLQTLGMAEIMAAMDTTALRHPLYSYLLS